MLYNPRLKSVFMFVPGVMTVILMLVSAMMTSIAITREKELGTMEVLLVSPLRPAMIIIGKVIPYILLALANTVVILLLGTFVFGMPVKGSLLLLALECLLLQVHPCRAGVGRRRKPRPHPSSSVQSGSWGPGRRTRPRNPSHIRPV